MSRHAGDSLSLGLLHLWFQAQTTQPTRHRWGWATSKQTFHKRAPLCQFQVLDVKADRKLTSSLGCFLNQLREKCNQPLSCLYDCAPFARTSIKISPLNIFHTDTKYFKRKGKHCCFLSFITFWNGKRKARDTIRCCYFLKSGTGLLTGPGKQAPLPTCA